MSYRTCQGQASGRCLRLGLRSAARRAGPGSCPQQRRTACHAGAEAPPTAQETQDLDERVQSVDSLQHMQHELEAAGDRLVIAEVMAEDVCETGLFEVEEGWSIDKAEKEEQKLAACDTLRHHFVKLAADSPNVRFLSAMEDSDGTSELCQHFNVKTFPSVLFIKNQQVVWRVAGSAKMRGDLSEGLVYFSEAPNLRSADHVTEMTTADEYRRFMADDDISDAKVVMYTTPMCSPCVHVYPSYVTLAANFAEKMSFARLDIEDEDPDVTQIFKEARILEVPTFVMYKNNKEVSRDVSSHRGDLIGHVLQTAMKLGIDPPRPQKAKR